MIELHHGDMRDVLARLQADGVLFDACVTDPPYHLTSIVKRFGGDKAAPAQRGTDGAFSRASRGFMGKQWDGGDIAFRPETWRAVFDVLKPGAHLVAFGGTRTMHRIVCAIEDAGFEIRDGLMWLYGCGFPKSHDVTKGIDKANGRRGTFGDPKSAAHAGWIERGRMRGADGNDGWQSPWMDDSEAVDRNARQYIPASPEARAWIGWGTALKPAFEPIVLARKPLIGTVAANVLAHGTGALNIDASRIGTDGGTRKEPSDEKCLTHSVGGHLNADADAGAPVPGLGRYPANVLHDGSDEVLEAFAVYGESSSGKGAVKKATGTGYQGNAYGKESRPAGTPMICHGDSGSVARFFYSAKADKGDRAESGHPTVKPIDLMRWLVTLITPPGGTVLDPFAGSGSTGEAAMLGGFNAHLIEREDEYARDIRHRIKRWSGADTPLFAMA